MTSTRSLPAPLPRLQGSSDEARLLPGRPVVPEEKPDCPVCHGARSDSDDSAARALNIGPPFGVRRCPSCGMRWLSPRPTAEEYDEMYRVAYFDEPQPGPEAPRWVRDYPAPPSATRRHHEHNAPFRAAHQQAQLIAINASRPGRGRMLEIGAGHGEFLHRARGDGWEVQGIEPSLAACRAARERFGLEMHCTTLDRCEADDPFDVVYLSHVFEHFLEPAKALDAIGSLLAPEGLLVIEVPNQFDSWVRRIAGLLRRRRPRPRTIYSIHHPLFFGPPQLIRLLEEHGYAVRVATHVSSDYAGGLRRRAMGLVDTAADRIARQGEVIWAMATRDAGNRTGAGYSR
jgi:SAM-dependent methyltransferase